MISRWYSVLCLIPLFVIKLAPQLKAVIGYALEIRKNGSWKDCQSLLQIADDVVQMLILCSVATVSKFPETHNKENVPIPQGNNHICYFCYSSPYFLLLT